MGKKITLAITLVFLLAFSAHSQILDQRLQDTTTGQNQPNTNSGDASPMPLLTSTQLPISSGRVGSNQDEPEAELESREVPVISPGKINFMIDEMISLNFQELNGVHLHDCKKKHSG